MTEYFGTKIKAEKKLNINTVKKIILNSYELRKHKPTVGILQIKYSILKI